VIASRGRDAPAAPAIAARDRRFGNGEFDFFAFS
jgi:hypothetical protein